MHYSVDDIKKFGTVLGVWAHPDDEVFSCAGLMQAAAQNGQKVISVTATYGDAGQSANEKKWPKKRLAEIRKQESDDALQLLGDIEQHWLGHKDGQLNVMDMKEAVEKIQSIIQNRKIDTILTFEKQGITGHEDHKAVHAWAVALAEKIPNVQILCAVENSEFYEEYGKKLHEKYNVYFNVKKPNVACIADVDVCFELPENFKQTKLASLKKHASQTATMFASKEGLEALNALCKYECFLKTTARVSVIKNTV